MFNTGEYGLTPCTLHTKCYTCKEVLSIACDCRWQSLYSWEGAFQENPGSDGLMSSVFLGDR